jgi:hypothetical protein
MGDPQPKLNHESTKNENTKPEDASEAGCAIHHEEHKEDRKVGKQEKGDLNSSCLPDFLPSLKSFSRLRFSRFRDSLLQNSVFAATKLL